jgi:hypothetical protein
MSSANNVGPAHYRRGFIEVWDFIHDQGLNYFLGNAIKYVCRAGYKESKVQDLQKAIHYLQKELELTNAASLHQPDPVSEPPIQWSPPLAWSCGTDLQDSDGFSLGDAR